MLKSLIIGFLICFIPYTDISEDSVYRDSVAYMVREVNRIRTTGCFCGDQYMPPADGVKWNPTLHRSALIHAKDMSRHNYFSHWDRKGRDVGDRLDLLGYQWLMVGENLGEGQRDFDEVLSDWLESDTHCEMLMSPKVDEMGIAKHGRFWVQHFGKRIPPNAVKKGKKIIIYK